LIDLKMRRQNPMPKAACHDQTTTKSNFPDESVGLDNIDPIPQIRDKLKQWSAGFGLLWAAARSLCF
jgi:hypothetical protein